MYVFAGVRARVFAFDGPAPAGGTGADGGGAGYSEDRLPSLLSSSLLISSLPSSLPPPSLPPAASGSRHLPPGPQPAGEAAVAAPAADLVLRTGLAMEPRRGGLRGRERGRTECRLGFGWDGWINTNAWVPSSTAPLRAHTALAKWRVLRNPAAEDEKQIRPVEAN